MKAIETRSLTKKYKDLTAVDSLDLCIPEGELFALLGVNGAGKTTVIKMLTALIKPTSGDAYIFGKSVVRDIGEIKKYINVSPQETAVAPNLTVKENLELIAGIHGNNRRKSKDMAEKIITRFNLGKIACSKAKTLSGGWQRRLSIAMALISEPRILFLDEPTIGLDIIARRELWQIIRNLKNNMTIMMTTHYLEEACALSDRIGIMANGYLRVTGTSEELIKKAGADNFEDAFISYAGERGADI